MGSTLSSNQPRDVTFEPQEIFLTEKALERMKASFTKEEDDSNYLNAGLQKEIELRDRYIHSLETRNNKLFETAAEEYTRTVERLENKYIKPTPGGCCTASEQRVVDCFKEKVGKILLCSKVISEYNRCVQNYRMAMVKDRTTTVSS